MEAYIAPAHDPSEEEFSAMKIMFFTKDRRTGMFAKHLKQLQPDVDLAALPAELKYKSKRGLDALPAVDKNKSKKNNTSIGVTDAPSAQPEQGQGQPQAAASSPTLVVGTETLELSGTLEDMLGQLLENPVSPNPLDLLDNTCSDAIASPHVMQSFLASPPTIDKATNMQVSGTFGDKYSGSIGIAPQQLFSDVVGAGVATGNNANGKKEVHTSSTAPIAKARSRAPNLTADERHAVLSSYLEQPDVLGDVFVPVRQDVVDKVLGNCQIRGILTEQHKPAIVKDIAFKARAAKLEAIS